MSRAEELRIRRVIASEAGKCSNCTVRPVLAGRMSCRVCTDASRARMPSRVNRVLSVSMRAYRKLLRVADDRGLTIRDAVELVVAQVGARS